MFGFGHNKYGQIGCKVTKNQTIPIRIEGFNDEKVESIACRALHALALTDVGHVYS
jgi:alpha-tubulin suppressor-like RCC1 family protein